MLIRLSLVILVWVFYVQGAFAETYVREYTYNASEADSKLTSRAIALDQVKTILLQEIGTHIRQKINVTKDGSGNTYASEDVEAITAGLTRVDILEEKWTGETYYLKASIDANTDRVLNAVEEFKKERTLESKKQLEVLKNNQRALKISRDEVARLRQQLKNVKGEAQKKHVANNYINQVGKISSSEMFYRGVDSNNLGNYEDAVFWYLKSAEQGNAAAQYNLAHKYRKGEGVKQDYQQAANWFRMAAEQGDADSQTNLGVLYGKGLGVVQDHQQAANWYRKAAEQGDGMAQSNLAGLYDKGKGVGRDYTAAAKWYRKSAEQGYADAQNNLGLMYGDGEGVEQDYTQAVVWLGKAASQGHSGAQTNLGVMYVNGTGVRQDKRIAKKWFGKGCDGGDQKGCEYYSRLNGQGY